MIDNSVIIQDSDERLVKVWATAEVKDSQGDFITADEVLKAMPNFMDFPAVTYEHSNKVIGKVISFNRENRENNGISIPGVSTLMKIKPSGVTADKAWADIKKGDIKGASIGGDMFGNGSVELYEIALTGNPANPLATIEAVSMAKSKNIAKPGNVDEAKWGKAKEIVSKEYPEISEESDRFWKLTQEVYQKMIEKSVKKTDQVGGENMVEEQKTPTVEERIESLEKSMASIQKAMKKAEEEKPKEEEKKPEESKEAKKEEAPKEEDKEMETKEAKKSLEEMVSEIKKSAAEAVKEAVAEVKKEAKAEEEKKEKVVSDSVPEETTEVKKSANEDFDFSQRLALGLEKI